MFKTILFAALASAALTLPALAGEGNGEPFPYRANGVTTTVTQQRVSYLGSDVGSNSYPDVTGRPGTVTNLVAGGVVPETGSEQVAQTDNSLPQGFEIGMPAYAQLQPALMAGRTGASARVTSSN